MFESRISCTECRVEALIVIGLVAAAVITLARSSGNRDSAAPPRETERLPPIRPNVPRPFNRAKSRPVAGPETLSGAAYVVDGDTITIRRTQIRLFGIDAPEMNHPHGRNAKSALISLCKGQQVRAEITDKDGHGRTVAKCYLPDGRDLSAEMVKLGLAIDWPKFSGGAYRSLETPDARKKMWLADARQKGRMHVWDRFETAQKERASRR